ncbi:MAG: tol-pal system protein YbgF [Cytophagaceae bacterium]|nr:tol-pal system protein YbgF [Cytophagaceae bacterium]
MSRILAFFLFLISFKAFPQESPKMLLMDMSVQSECTDAVNDMYNFKFEKAEKQFQILKLKYPEHPLPYFLMGLSTWWKIMPNIDNTNFDDTFLAYMDTSIAKAEKLYEEDATKIEAAFFLSGAYGFKAQLHGERDNYAKSTFAGKNALKHLMEFKDNNELSPEFLFGVALYNYYEVWIKEEYPLLKPILLFFPNGDKNTGLKQLQEVSNNAFYTRTEAQYHLVKIYLNDLDSFQVALPMIKYLWENYPDNAFFERTYAKTLFYMSMNNDLEPICLDILKKFDSGTTGYEETSARWACYFLGNIYRYRNKAQAKEYFFRSTQLAEKIGATDQGYYLYSLKNLAEIAEDEKDPELAKAYYKKIKKFVPGSEDELKKLKKEAKKKIKEQEKKKGN